MGYRTRMHMERFRKYLDVTHQYEAIAALLASMAVSDEVCCAGTRQLSLRFAPFAPFAACRRARAAREHIY
jgi:hypothetical protein